MELPAAVPDIRFDYDAANHVYTAVLVSDGSVLFRQYQNNLNGINVFGLYNQNISWNDFGSVDGFTALTDASAIYRSLVKLVISSLDIRCGGFSVPFTITEVIINGENILASPISITDDQFTAADLIDSSIEMPVNSRISITTDPAVGEFITVRFNQ